MSATPVAALMDPLVRDATKAMPSTRWKSRRLLGHFLCTGLALALTLRLASDTRRRDRQVALASAPWSAAGARHTPGVPLHSRAAASLGGRTGATPEAAAKAQISRAAVTAAEPSSRQSHLPGHKSSSHPLRAMAASEVDSASSHDVIGFLGIGIMGTGMCHNLLKEGKRIIVWNRDASKAEALSAEETSGGRVSVASSVQEVVRQSTVIYSMLSTEEASKAVWPEVLSALEPGKMVVDAATFTPERMASMRTQAAAKGAMFLEAPVSGSKGPAEAGQLIFLTAGDSSVKEAVAADLEAMGKSTFYFGSEVGKGTEMKLVVNMIMGTQLNALAEGIALTEAYSLSVQDLFEVLKLGAMNSPLVQLKVPGMMNKDYAPAFPLVHAQKDMRFAIGLGDHAGLALPVAAASNEEYKKARGMGFGDQDFSAVVEASRDPNIRVRPSEPATTGPSAAAKADADEEVGFIGVGIMGLGMCRNLLRSGRRLVVWNRDRSKADALAAEEASAGKVTVVDSARDVIKRCKLTYSMLSTIEASEAIFPEVLSVLEKGKMLVDAATFTPERMAQMKSQAAAKGALFLEAPVSGSKGPAEAGQLIFLTSGDSAVRDAAAADLEAMGKATFYFGKHAGKGTEMKLIVNMIMGIQLNALAEGIALAEAYGLPVEELLHVLKLGVMNSPMVQLKGPAMLKHEYAPAFPLVHAQKDMRFAIGLGDKAGLALPVAAASNEQYKKARGMGLGHQDFAAVAQASRGPR